MRLSSSSRLLIGACCALMLLSAQVLGLHYHRHFDAHQDHGAHAPVLATWDAAAHVPGVEEALSAHAGTDLDIELTSLSSPKPKQLAALVALLPGIALHAPSTRGARVPHHSNASLPRPARYSLRPPSQAPPSLV
jgi:hypothetical protein